MPSKQRPIIGGEIAIDLILLYAAYNQKYFQNKLPHNVAIFWATKDKIGVDCMARCYHTAPAIVMLDELKEFPCVAQLSLLHEMVHLEFPKAGHGKKFVGRMRQLAKQGAFDKLW